MKPDLQKQLYKEMLRIRRVEEAIADNYSKQQMRCPVHLSIGQEAVPVAVSAHLSDEDLIYSNHRCHAHYLAKGGGIKEMICELHGKVNGCARGKGGSMHLVAPEKGMMGASALVGGTIPMGVGAALALSREKSQKVAVSYFGDGASEEGLFYESLNFAALHKLPMLFICENNNWATYSPQKARQATPDIYRRGESFGIASAQGDGTDVEACYELAGEAVERARSGQGPTLLEFSLRRYRDHVGPSMDWEPGHTTQEEVEKWMEKCPIESVKKKLISSGDLSEADVTEIEKSLRTEIDQSFELAEKSPLPELKELYTEIYASH